MPHHFVVADKGAYELAGAFGPLSRPLWTCLMCLMRLFLVLSERGCDA
jgi:hypothetical protein